MNIMEQVVMDKKGNAIAVQISMTRYKKILEKLEELDDIKAFDKAMKRKHQFIPFEDSVKHHKSSRKK